MTSPRHSQPRSKQPDKEDRDSQVSKVQVASIHEVHVVARPLKLTLLEVCRPSDYITPDPTNDGTIALAAVMHEPMVLPEAMDKASSEFYLIPLKDPSEIKIIICLRPFLVY
jgi:hypothetical protein